MRLEGHDHLVLTVADIDGTRDFYERVLGMGRVVFGVGPHALAFGRQKINLHEAGRGFEPEAAAPAPGPADSCFWTRTPPGEVVEHLRSADVEIEQGLARRTGARGPIDPVYLRDPGGNPGGVSTYGRET